MAITKDQKKKLVEQYVEDLKSSNNTVIVKQKSVPVNVANQIRKDIVGSNGKLNVIRKRIFLRAIKEAGLDDVDLSNLDGSVVALYAKGDEFAPLKVINKYKKEFKTEDKPSEFSFLGGWFGTKRESAEYVDELANVPTKEELYSKLCYLFNYPLQSFACVLSEIAKKGESGKLKVESKEEAKASISEVPQGGIKVEAKVEEVKTEAPVVEAPVVEAPVMTEQSEGIPQHGGEPKVE